MSTVIQAGQAIANLLAAFCVAAEGFVGFLLLLQLSQGHLQLRIPATGLGQATGTTAWRAGSLR